MSIACNATVSVPSVDNRQAAFRANWQRPAVVWPIRHGSAPLVTLTVGKQAAASEPLVAIPWKNVVAWVWFALVAFPCYHRHGASRCPGRRSCAGDVGLGLIYCYRDSSFISIKYVTAMKPLVVTVVRAVLNPLFGNRQVMLMPPSGMFLLDLRSLTRRYNRTNTVSMLEAFLVFIVPCVCLGFR